jgi:glycolate oxidase iron-sulfur subunit
MQTSLLDKYKNTPEGREAEEILRSCVHCGFCTATCPTYQQLGDELDGPRGRIYLIKQVLEGKEVSSKTQSHLDRCLTCRSCETTCPSGVRYGRLVDIGRHIVEQQVNRSFRQKLMRTALRAVIPYQQRFGSLLKLGQAIKPLLPQALARKVPNKQIKKTWPVRRHPRRMLVLDGCAQPAATPNTNIAAAQVLDRLGIQLIRAKGAGCCGAVSQHLSAQDEALDFMRRNIDAWWPYIEAGAEAIVMTASGCGIMVKDYGELLKDDARYADKARRVAELTRDISEILSQEDLSVFRGQGPRARVAFHAPCTLQHGQKITGVVEKILESAGYQLTQVNDSHLCCGSAGTYSILQPELSQRLLADKLDSLNQGEPDYIATANVGCQLHMSSKANIPVKHWIELLVP